MTDISAQDVQTAFQSKEAAILYIKYAFITGLGVFILSLPFCRSKKSFFDPIAAKKILKYLRTAVFLELFCLGILFYFYITYGIPLILNAQFSFGNIYYSGNWLYSFPRPTFGVIFITMGMFAESHPIIRVFCMIGCIAQVFGDAFSAFQINDYRNQQLHNSAPRTNGYTPNILLSYFWRDIISIALSTYVFLMMAHLTNIVGWCDPQLIHPSLLTGRDYDRYSAMKRNRGERIMMEKLGVIESSTPSTSLWGVKQKSTKDFGAMMA